MSVHLDRLQLLEIDIDTRLVDEWTQAGHVPDDGWTLDLVGRFMRAAYAKGYTDALSESVRGRLCREHGYETPRRRV